MPAFHALISAVSPSPYGIKACLLLHARDTRTLPYPKSPVVARRGTCSVPLVCHDFWIIMRSVSTLETRSLLLRRYAYMFRRLSASPPNFDERRAGFYASYWE